VTGAERKSFFFTEKMWNLLQQSRKNWWIWTKIPMKTVKSEENKDFRLAFW
jgi:hypothetical protein